MVVTGIFAVIGDRSTDYVHFSVVMSVFPLYMYPAVECPCQVFVGRPMTTFLVHKNLVVICQNKVKLS